MKKTLAFTLAETLIVMGIIGVVAALTLPNLNSSTGDKEKIVKLQKIYQNLNDAYGRATAVYGPFTEWGLNWDSESSSKKAAGRLSEFMKISKDCGFQSSNSACFASSMTNYTDGTKSTWIPNPGYDYMLSDGTSISIEANRDGMAVDVDIDGPNKGKHQLGSDHFYFSVQ